MDIRDAIKANNTAIEAIDLVKDYGSGSNAVHALRDVNIAFEQGKFTVIMGPSGSGKSTMCRTINRLETIDSGDIRIDGKPLPQEGKELASLRAEVGMVFQSFNLFANKTILENVTLAPIKVRHMDKKAAEDLAMDLLGRVGVASQASKIAVSAFRRPAAACRHRPRPRHAAEGHAVRRADVRSRPGNGQRSA